MTTATLHVDIIETSDEKPVTLTKQSACKAWLGMDQIGTQAIHGSFNIASTTDSATGTTIFTFTNNFSNVNYCGTATAHNTGVASHACPYPGDPDATGSHTTSETQIQCYINAGGTGDASVVNYHAMGDLA